MKKFVFTFLLFTALCAFLILFTQDYSRAFYPNIQDAHASQVALEPTLTDFSHAVDTSQSIVGWKGALEYTHVSYSGSIDIASGGAEIVDGEVVGGAFVLDMNSFASPDTTSEHEAHLFSDDFLSVEKYPTAYFEIRSVEHTDDSEYAVEGALTMRGISRVVEFPAVIRQENGTFIADAQFSLDRTDWGIKYGSDTFYSDLGENVISDIVQITLHLVVR